MRNGNNEPSASVKEDQKNNRWFCPAVALLKEKVDFIMKAYGGPVQLFANPLPNALHAVIASSFGSPFTIRPSCP